MMQKALQENRDLLYEAILELHTVEECRLFFADLCTSQEINAMVQRLVVAKMLGENKSYAEIVEQTGTSTATVSRVKRSCENYQIALRRLKTPEER